jgi:hypothetical protein
MVPPQKRQFRKGNPERAIQDFSAGKKGRAKAEPGRRFEWILAGED